MHYHDEVVSPAEAEISVQAAKASKAEEQMAEHLVEVLTRPVKLDELRDEYRERVMDVIRRRAAGEDVVLPAVEEIPPTYNIADALRRSLEQAGSPPASDKRKSRSKRKAAPTRRRRKAG
jgi:DNA end-binding protein Ku